MLLMSLHFRTYPFLHRNSISALKFDIDKYRYYFLEWRILPLVNVIIFQIFSILMARSVVSIKFDLLIWLTCFARYTQAHTKPYSRRRYTNRRKFRRKAGSEVGHDFDRSQGPYSTLEPGRGIRTYTYKAFLMCKYCVFVCLPHICICIWKLGTIRWSKVFGKEHG